MTSFIKSAVDHNDILQGDVVIVKHAFLDGKALKTKCSACGDLFDTSFRRMGKIGTARGMEVRNVPQCVSCRGKYKKALKAQVIEDETLRPGDYVRCVEGGNFQGAEALVKGETYTVSEVAFGGKWVALAERATRGLASFAYRFKLLGVCDSGSFLHPKDDICENWRRP